MKRPSPPKLVTVTVSTTITIIFWIFFTLYQILTTKPVLGIDPTILEPINPELDTKTLESISQRLFFEEGSFIPPKIQNPSGSDSLPEQAVQSSPTPTTIPEESPLPTEELPVEE